MQSYGAVAIATGDPSPVSGAGACVAMTMTSAVARCSQSDHTEGSDWFCHKGDIVTFRYDTCDGETQNLKCTNE